MRELVKTLHYRAGYQVRTERISGDEAGGGGHSFLLRSAFTPDGLYLGTPKVARLLIKRGIQQFELAQPAHNVCSVGFNPEQQQWFGWSHRAIFGFGIGSVVKPGDVAFCPSNEDEFLDEQRRWYSGEPYEGASVTRVPQGALITFSVKGPGDARPANRVEGWPKQWGRGEWVAQTLEDAKQMALDFAEDVS